MQKERILGRVMLLGVFLLPSVAFAQLTKFTTIVIKLLNNVVYLIMAMALFAFVIGVIRFIATAGDEKSRAEGKQMMVWGTLSLFVMVAVWGLVAIIKKTFFG